MSEVLHFSIDGEFITDFARRKLYEENDFNKAIQFLLDCTMTDQISYEERYNKCLAVLDGTQCLAGVYPSPDYGFYEEKEPKHRLSEYFGNLHKKLNKLEEDNAKLLENYLDLYESTDFLTHDRAEQKKINREVENEHLQHLSDDSDNFFSNYTDTNSLMGFIEPDGTFHQVNFGEHNNWARDYLEKHYDIQGKDSKLLLKEGSTEDEPKFIYNADVLVYNLHWVLLDNPQYGIPSPTYNENYGLTRKQKEVLYDFYIATGQHIKANKLYEID